MNDYLIYVFGLKDENILKHGLGEKTEIREMGKKWLEKV